MHWYVAEVTCRMGITGYTEEDAREALIEHLQLATEEFTIHKFYLKMDNAWTPEENV